MEGRGGMGDENPNPPIRSTLPKNYHSTHIAKTIDCCRPRRKIEFAGAVAEYLVDFVVDSLVEYFAVHFSTNSLVESLVESAFADQQTATSKKRFPPPPCR